MTKNDVEVSFWDWFINHEAELFDFERDQERIFDQLASELQKVDPNLSFEFGPKQSSVREFVISASGIKNAFPSVISLAQAAPQLDRWRVASFRARRSPINTVRIDGKTVDPADVQFTLLDNGKHAGIYLFIPGFREGDATLAQIGYLLLDEALGEYDVETHLGLIKMLPPNADAEETRYGLRDLAVQFDRLIARLEGCSGKPS